MIEIIVILFEILIFYVIQSTMFNYIPLLNIVPNLLLILVTSIAYIKGQNYGMFTGFLVGLLLDITYGRVFGLYAGIYVTIGYFAGYSNLVYSEEDYILPMIILSISNFVYNFLYYIFEFLLRGKLDFLFYLRRMILPEVIYTLLVSVVVYKIIHIINIKIDTNYHKEN